MNIPLLFCIPYLGVLRLKSYDNPADTRRHLYPLRCIRAGRQHGDQKHLWRRATPVRAGNVPRARNWMGKQLARIYRRSHDTGSLADHAVWRDVEDEISNKEPVRQESQHDTWTEMVLRHVFDEGVCGIYESGTAVASWQGWRKGAHRKVNRSTMDNHIDWQKTKME